ncbi:MAG: ATP-binding protein [Candidatus Altiarchaeota archaeon]|nr:ATP-binding protein [Candidatus Altiarchaeota archaeon]
MALRQVGSISGEVRPNTFEVLITDVCVERGSYVKVKHDAYGWVLARIESLKRYLDDFDEESLMAGARTIGYLQENNILVPKTPFKPNEKVYLADTELITSILGLKTGGSGSIYLGMLEGHDIPVYLDIKKTIGKHMSVLAKTGAGKSYTVGVILEELLKTNMPVVIIDPHGEYASLKVENDEYDAMLKYGIKAASYKDKILEYAINTELNAQSKKLALTFVADTMELSEILPLALSDKQKSVIFTALRDLDSDVINRGYTIDDLILRVEQEPINLKWKVIEGLEELKKSGVFDGTPVKPDEIVKKGNASIINLLGAEPRIQQLVVAKLIKELFDARRTNQIPEFFFLIEESHNFCPERGFGDAISSDIIRTVASEGRKFGFQLCVVSQRPARVDKNVLSQCGTQIILKVTNPNDLRAIGRSIEGFTSNMENEIKQLPVGHALVVGECVEQPVTVCVRIRETKHGRAVKPRDDDEPEETERPLPKKRAVKKKEKEERGLFDIIMGFFIKDDGEA